MCVCVRRQDDVGGAKSLWNSLLFDRVVAPSYVAVLQSVASDIGGHLSTAAAAAGDGSDPLARYRRLFPHLSADVAGYWSTLLRAVYRDVARSSLALLPVVRDAEDPGTAAAAAAVEWHAVHDDQRGPVYFDNLQQTFPTAAAAEPLPGKSSTSRTSRPSAPQPPASAAVADRLRRALLAVGFPLVSLPSHVCASFEAAGVAASYVSPSAVVAFFASSSSSSSSSRCRVADSSLPVDVADSRLRDDATVRLVLSYCLRDVELGAAAPPPPRLDGLPLLLCHDNLLRAFSAADPVFRTAHLDLVPGLGARFLHSAVLDAHFADAVWDGAPEFRSFDVQSFADLLPSILPACVYGPPNERALRSV